MLLDGLWKFRYSKNAASRPADFYKEGYDDSNFDMIRVPGRSGALRQRLIPAKTGKIFMCLHISRWKDMMHPSMLMSSIHGKDMSIADLHIALKMLEMVLECSAKLRIIR